MVDWIRTIAIAAIAAQGCALEEGVLDEGGDDGHDDDDDDAPADESASYTSAAESDESGDDEPPERIPVECGASLHAACEALLVREAECGATLVDEGETCDEVLAYFPQTPECCTALAEFIACAVALPCDDDRDGCAFLPAGECDE